MPSLRCRRALLPLALALAGLAAGATPGFAQSNGAPGNEAARLEYTDLARAPVESGSGGAEGSLALISRDALLVLPLTALDAPALWFAGGWARETALGFNGFRAGQPGLVRALNRRGLVLGTVQQLPGGRDVTAVLAAGYFTTNDDYNVPVSIGGYAVWHFPLSEHSRWGIGANATSELGDPTLLPVLEYRAWQPRWTADVRLPLDADARWWPAPWLSLGGQWQARGGSYHAADGRLPYDTVRYRTGTLAAVLGIGARTGVLLDLIWGTTLFRGYRALADDETVLRLNFRPETAIGAKLAMRF